MKRTTRFLALFLSLLVTVLAAACAPRPMAASAGTPTPTPTATPAPTPTPAPTATPEPTEAPTPTPEPTPIVDEFGFTEERKAELNQQFQDFLNKEGEFTPEKMSIAMMETISNLDKSKVGLGIVDTGDTPYIQGYLFDYLEKDGRIFLFVGFDGRDGNRFITPLEIPIYYYESFEPTPFYIMEYEEEYSIMAASRGKDVTGEDYSDDKGKLLSLLNALRGKVLVFGLKSQNFSGSSWDRFDLDAETRKNVTDYVEEVNSKVVLSFGLFQLLPQNGIPPYENPDKIKGDSESILRLTSPEEMGQINIDQVPTIMIISYFSGELTAEE